MRKINKDLLFEIKSIEYTDGGVKIIKYTPKYNMKIPAIDLRTGKIEKKRIIEYSEHYGLNMYRIENTIGEKFKPFYVSEDHSLIVFDVTKDELRKESPKNLIGNSNDDLYFLIREEGHRTCTKFALSKYWVYFSSFNIRLMPIKYCHISYDPTKTFGYDFTVEDYYTFMTKDGVFVQDTMAIYLPLTKEDQENAKKLLYTHRVFGSAKYKKPAIAIKAEEIVGLYLMTKDK